MNQPCCTCPWRKSSTIGGADIPNFNLEMMRGLSNTVGNGDAFRPIMACHYSACGAESACIGYVAVEGSENISVRLMAIKGELDLSGIAKECEELDLWESFAEMLEAYEIASES